MITISKKKRQKCDVNELQARGLVRQYLPKGTDLSGYNQEQLDAIADEMNRRPRKILDWATHLEVYNQWLARLKKGPEAIQ